MKNHTQDCQTELLPRIIDWGPCHFMMKEGQIRDFDLSNEVLWSNAGKGISFFPISAQKKL